MQLLDQLLETCTDKEAAERLNELGHRNWQGQTFTEKKVGLIRRTYGLRSRYERLRALGFITANELAKQLDVSNATIHTWGATACFSVDSTVIPGAVFICLLEVWWWPKARAADARYRQN